MYLVLSQHNSLSLSKLLRLRLLTQQLRKEGKKDGIMLANYYLTPLHHELHERGRERAELAGSTLAIATRLLKSR